MSQKCIGCDTPIPYGAIKCPMCGAPLKIALKKDLEAPSIEATTSQIPKMTTGKSCKQCTMAISVAAKTCPYCGKGQNAGIPRSLQISFFIIIALSISFNIMRSGHRSEKNVLASEEALTEKGNQIKSAHSSWSNSVCNSIGNKLIRIGMTTEQVLLAWGRKPHKINNTVSANATHEQWVMHDDINTDYLYFKDGILYSIQQSK